MTLRTIRRAVLAGIAIPALLTGCGKEDAEEVGTRYGSIVENAADAAIVDLTAGSPLDKPFRMNNADPGDLDRFQALLESAEEKPFQVSEASFDDNIGAIVLTGVSNTEGGRVFTIGRVELFGLNLDYLEALRDGEAVAQTQEVARKIRMFDLSLSGYADLDFDGTLTVDALEFDRLNLGDISVSDDDAADEIRPSGFGLAGLYLKELTLERQDDVSAMDLAIADLRMSDVARGHFGPVTMRAVELVTERVAEENTEAPETGLYSELLLNMFAPEQRRIAIEALKWDGADTTGFIARPDTTPKQVGDLPPVGSIGQLEATDVTIEVNGKPASYTEYFMFEPMRLSGSVPQSVRIATHGNITDMTAYLSAGDTALASVMRDQGLDELRSESEITWTYEQETGAADIVYDVDMPGYGRIDLSMGVTGLSPEVLSSAAGEEGVPAMVSTSLSDFSLVIEDRKLIDAFVAVAAAELGEEPETLRKNLPAYVALGSSRVGGDQMQTYVALISDFLTEGGTLEISASPENPVPLEALGLMALVSPSMMPDVLGLDVQHTE